MESSRPIYPSPQLLGDDLGLSRLRQPLTDAAGNSQLQTLPLTGPYDDKGPHLRGKTPQIVPTLPSQPPRHSLGSNLELRRQSMRRRRNPRFGRNPIVDSQQYQAYRARQNREGSSDDQKWPAILEDAFLDGNSSISSLLSTANIMLALIEIPTMGRRKYSYKGKPHGRNELIKEYLWIAYCQSLAPGQRPDLTMKRTRKQVSSHIQVLKGFLKDHPACKYSPPQVKLS